MTTSTPLNILGLTNSLRADSYNRMTMVVVDRLMSPLMRATPFDIAGIPFFEPELDPLHAPLSQTMQSLSQALDGADGVLITVPEYNHSIPGRLKNALDMISRLPSQPMEGMPVMILSASVGRLGGIRAQYELRRVLDAIGAVTLTRPEVFIGEARTKFNDAGDCTDVTAVDLIRVQIEAFRRMIALARVYQKTDDSLT